MAAIIRFDLDVSKMTVDLQSGCCTTVVVYKSINKNGERSTFIYNNFHAERAQYVSVPFCSSWEQKLCNMFFIQLFYSQFDILKHEDSIVFNSVSRNDDVYTKKCDVIYR